LELIVELGGEETLLPKGRDLREAAKKRNWATHRLRVRPRLFGVCFKKRKAERERAVVGFTFIIERNLRLRTKEVLKPVAGVEDSKAATVTRKKLGGRVLPEGEHTKNTGGIRKTV